MGRTRRVPPPGPRSTSCRATAGSRWRAAAPPELAGARTEAAPNNVGRTGVEKVSFEENHGAKSGSRRKGSRSLGRCHQETLSAGTRGRPTYTARDYIATGPSGGWPPSRFRGLVGSVERSDATEASSVPHRPPARAKPSSRHPRILRMRYAGPPGGTTFEPRSDRSRAPARTLREGPRDESREERADARRAVSRWRTS